jgi:hypothetical protein
LTGQSFLIFRLWEGLRVLKRLQEALAIPFSLHQHLPVGNV